MKRGHEQVEPRVRPPDGGGRAVKRCALVVAGMYRSGTSAVAACLSSLGASLPRTPRRPGVGNDPRWGESEPMVELHDDLLASVGSSWDDVAPFPDSWYGSGDAADYQARMLRVVEAEYAGASLFVVEDPRICRLVPFWIAVLDDLEVQPAFVLPFRNPFVVAALLERNHRVPMGKGLLAWLRHILDAERYTRSLPRAVVEYEDVIRDWRASTRAISEALGVTWPIGEQEVEAGVNGFLSSDQQGQAPSPEELEGRIDAVPWVRDAYELMLDAYRSGDPPDPDSLDAIGAALADAARAYGPVLAESRLRAAAVQGRLDYASKQLKAREREFSTFKDDLEARDRKIASLNEVIASIERSPSWRVTKPLRWAKSLIKKVLRRR